MKTKNYEKKSLVIIMIVIILLLELFFTITLTTIKIIKYKKYSLIVVEDNKSMIILPKKEKEIWYKNTYLYIKNKKIKYKIEEINEENNYSRLVIKMNAPKKNKINDIVTISIEKERINIIKLIIDTWGGD